MFRPNSCVTLPIELSRWIHSFKTALYLQTFPTFPKTRTTHMLWEKEGEREEGHTMVSLNPALSSIIRLIIRDAQHFYILIKVLLLWTGRPHCQVLPTLLLPVFMVLHFPLWWDYMIVSPPFGLYLEKKYWPLSQSFLTLEIIGDWPWTSSFLTILSCFLELLRHSLSGKTVLDPCRTAQQFYCFLM